MKTYLILLLAGWASGISLYLTVALLGIAGRSGWILLPGSLEVLSHPVVITAALFMYAVEFVADKVPYVDSAWDAVHTFIRPAGALALGVLAGTEDGPVVQTVLALLTGAVTLETHVAKSSLRLAVNASPEPVSNILTSLAEHSAVLVLFWLYVKHPVGATVVLVLVLVGLAAAIKFLWKSARRLFGRRRLAP
jgi:hypothetical protein